MLELLPEDRWPELTEIFKREFDTDLPAYGKSDILAEVVDGEVRGFMVMEFLGRLGQIWHTGNQTRAMFEAFQNMIPPGNSVIAIPCEPRFEKICERFGMRREKGVVYRKDF